MTRPTTAQLQMARSTLPQRRVSPSLSSAARPAFANVLQSAASSTVGAPAKPTLGRVSPRLAGATAAASDAQFITAPGAGPANMSRSDILQNAEQFLNVPYVWGGTSASGLDCSAFVSRAWGVSRHTTDNLSAVSRPVDKSELEAGDALNLTTGKDPDGAGHVRLFDRWANPEKTKMWVYEETPPRSIHHVINWDPNYQGMRRLNVSDA